jgi:hypothetical protein
MMCGCEEEFARRYLKHQITRGRDLHTQQEVTVTLGFQTNICDACRGLPEKPHPKAPMPGRTSKIARYYWRQIAFGTIKKFAEWSEQENYADAMIALAKHTDKYRAFEKEVIKEIKKLHQHSPKYVYDDTPQSEVLAKYGVEIVRLDAMYLKRIERGAAILEGDNVCSPEDFVCRHFERNGYQALLTESRPFHVLFGVFMWMLIEDPDDPALRIAGFGSRDAMRAGGHQEQVWTFLPSDFGARAYCHRRAPAIEKHLSELPNDKEALTWLFDYWLKPSELLRQYLWAHDPIDIAAARKVVTVLPVDALIRILRYLVAEYWQRYCGWPDALFYNGHEFFFAEIKSSRDSLSEDQKNWIHGNATELHLPFKLVKIHKKGVVNSQ